MVLTLTILLTVLIYRSGASHYNNTSGELDSSPDVQRLARMDYQYVEGWSPYKGRSSYYQTAPDESNKFSQPRYEEDSYFVTQKQEKSCKEVKSVNAEDGLTQITNAVVKISKMLFGVFVIIMLPLILAKMFLLPLKLMLVLKLLLKLALFWPIFSRLYGGLPLTTSVFAKLSNPSDADFRHLIDMDMNNTRVERSLNGAESSICDAKMACFITKTISSENYSVKIIMSVAILLDDNGSKLRNIFKMLKNKKGYEDCSKIQCYDSAVQKVDP